MEWTGTKISVWNIEDARMEWNGRFEEWNGRQSFILPYQFHTRFRALYLLKNICGCRVVINSIVTEILTLISTGIICRQSRYFGCVAVYIAQSVRIASSQVNWNLQH